MLDDVVFVNLIFVLVVEVNMLCERFVYRYYNRVFFGMYLRYCRGEVFRWGEGVIFGNEGIVFCRFVVKVIEVVGVFLVNIEVF